MAIAFAVLSWLCMAESSPFRSYFLWHPALGNLMALLDLPAILVGTLLSGNVHQPNEVVTYLAVAAQWFGIGYAISVLAISSSE